MLSSTSAVDMSPPTLIQKYSLQKYRQKFRKKFISPVLLMICCYKFDLCITVFNEESNGADHFVIARFVIELLPLCQKTLPGSTGWWNFPIITKIKNQFKIKHALSDGILRFPQKFRVPEICNFTKSPLFS
jgi:hypothetical protein